MMTQLSDLSLHGNKGMSGRVPSELSQLINLASDLRIGCGEIACDCCTSSNLVPCDPSTPSPTPVPTTTPITGSLALNKGQRIQVKTIRATFSDPSQLTATDDALVFPSDTTDYTHTPAVKSQYFGSGAGDGK